MNLYNLIKKYSNGKGESVMWDIVAIVSDSIDKSMPEKERVALMKKVYSEIGTGHYNQEFAEEEIVKMYYTDKSDEKQYAPYWDNEEMAEIYEQYKDEIPGYNLWDFAVTMNMLKSDMCNILHRWFPNNTDSDNVEKVIELSLNWLNDEDWPTKTKIWDYFNK